MQLAHHEIKNHSHNQSITLLLDHVERPANIGLILRTAEGMGVCRVVIASHLYTQLTPKIKRLTRSTEHNIIFEFVENSLDFLKRTTPQTPIYAIEKTNKSINYTHLKTIPKSCILVCGNEKNGISQDVLDHCSTHLHIPMYGINTSLNVAVATGIVLSHCVNNVGGLSTHKL